MKIDNNVKEQENMDLEINDNIQETFIKLHVLNNSSKNIYKQLPAKFKKEVVTNYSNENILSTLEKLEADIKYWLKNYERVFKELNIKIK